MNFEKTEGPVDTSVTITMNIQPHFHTFNSLPDIPFQTSPWYYWLFTVWNANMF